MRVFAFLVPSILLMGAAETAQAQDTRDKTGIIVQGGKTQTPAKRGIIVQGGKTERGIIIVGGKKRGIIVQGGKTKKKKPTGT